MKLAFYGLWEDEITRLSALQRQYFFESVRSREVFSVKNASLCECCDGVSLYGNATVGEETLRTLSSYGVKFLSVRDEETEVDYEAAKRLHIRVCRSTFPPDAVAEFTLMLALVALRKYKRAIWLQQVNDYSIDTLKGEILAQKKVGVVGEGEPVKRLTEILQGIGCRVRVHGEDDGGSLDEFYADSEVIMYPAKLKRPENYRVDRETLAKMREGVVLVNTASGDIFDVPSVIEGVENKKIGVLAMDVFKGERGIYHENKTDDILQNRDMAYLRQFPNVILTQHMGFYTAYSMEMLVERSVEGLVQMIRGGESEYEVK